MELKNIANEVLAETDERDAYEVAKRMLNKLTPDQYAEALLLTLPAFVRSVYASQRQALRNPSADEEYDVETQLVATGHGAPKPKQVYKPSPKVAAIREAWEKKLDTTIHVEDGYKKLRELTYRDLLFAVDERKALAHKNLAAADMYQDFADVIKSYDVATFGDLPKEAQRKLFNEHDV